MCIMCVYVCVQPLSGREWHTDGMRKGRLHPFSMLLGRTTVLVYVCVSVLLGRRTCIGVCVCACVCV